jgi:hypothetical protein
MKDFLMDLKRIINHASRLTHHPPSTMLYAVMFVVIRHAHSQSKATNLPL